MEQNGDFKYFTGQETMQFTFQTSRSLKSKLLKVLKVNF